MCILLLLAITAGGRIPETFALRYSDIDFTANTIYIDRQLGIAIKDGKEENLVTQQMETKTPNGVRGITIFHRRGTRPSGRGCV